MKSQQEPQPQGSSFGDQFNRNLVLMADTDCCIIINYSRTIASELFGDRFAQFLTDTVLKRYQTVLMVSSAIVLGFHVWVAFVHEFNQWSFEIFFAWLPGLFYAVSALLLLQYDLFKLGLQHFETLYLTMNAILFGIFFQDCFHSTMSSVIVSLAGSIAFLCAAFVDAWPISFRKVESRLKALREIQESYQQQSVAIPVQQLEQGALAKSQSHKVSVARRISEKVEKYFRLRRNVRNLNENISRGRLNSSLISIAVKLSSIDIVYLSKRVKHAIFNLHLDSSTLNHKWKKLDLFLMYGLTSVIIPIICVTACISSYFYLLKNEDQLRSRTISFIGIRLEVLGLLRSSLIGMAVMFTRKTVLLAWYPLRLSCVSRKHLRIPLSKSLETMLRNEQYLDFFAKQHVVIGKELFGKSDNGVSIQDTDLVLLTNRTKIQKDEAVENRVIDKSPSTSHSSWAKDDANHGRKEGECRSSQSVHNIPSHQNEDQYGSSKDSVLVKMTEAELQVVEFDQTFENVIPNPKSAKVNIFGLPPHIAQEIERNLNKHELKADRWCGEDIHNSQAEQLQDLANQRGSNHRFESGRLIRTIGQKSPSNMANNPEKLKRAMAIVTPNVDSFVIDYSKLVYDHFASTPFDRRFLKKVRRVLNQSMVIVALGPIIYAIHLILDSKSYDQFAAILYGLVMLQRAVTFLVYSWDAYRIAVFQFENLFATVNLSTILICRMIVDHAGASRMMGTFAMWISSILVIFLDAEPISMRLFNTIVEEWTKEFASQNTISSADEASRLMLVTKSALNQGCLGAEWNRDVDKPEPGTICYDFDGYEMKSQQGGRGFLRKLVNLPKLYYLGMTSILAAGIIVVLLFILNEYDLMTSTNHFSFDFLGKWDSKSLIRTGCFNVLIVLCKRFWCQANDPYRSHSFDRQVMKIPLVPVLQDYQDIELPNHKRLVPVPGLKD